MILAMIRHGQTDYNYRRLVQGRIDNPLNDTGRNQASTLGNLLKDLGDSFDILGASPLVRAHETAQIVGKTLGMEVSFLDSNFMERDFGNYEGMSIDIALPVVTKDEFREEKFEDNPSLEKRIREATHNLFLKYQDKKVLFVAHAHVIKALLICSDKSKYTYTNHYVGNSSIVYFDVTADKVEVIKQIDL
ncbi:histidine phosphatase family protein [Acholeplasma hippikon]|uniref:Phosphoglyceromutase n=1 Tax=Acholeplasma hippikon TaxID=264636 RepID=A0A449BIV5_9MOLU|nr:histidine phosphatase family protein [Acholeplasma hippikon]VEU82368.1 Phosphoglyceromutase [Acholeplasma hippikon]